MENVPAEWIQDMGRPRGPAQHEVVAQVQQALASAELAPMTSRLPQLAGGIADDTRANA